MVRYTPFPMTDDVRARNPRWECECGNFTDAPMLKHELWLSIADKRDLLCLSCTVKKLGRPITVDDLLEVPINGIVFYLEDQRNAGQTLSSDDPKHCASSPDGRHQVDTSMESGPNNCFYCEKPMSEKGRNNG